MTATDWPSNARAHLARVLFVRMRAVVVAIVIAAPSIAAPLANAQTTETPSAQKGELVAPKLLSDSTVAYPAGAKGDAIVILTVTVAADGSVSAATPAEVNEPFSSLASRAALSWRFEPAVRDGKAVAARIRFRVAFNEPPPPAPPRVLGDAPAPSASAPSPAPAPSSSPSPTGSAARVPPPSPAQLDEVLVRGAHVEPSRSVSLTRAEVRQIPGVFGDPFRAIEIMPGVTPIISGLPFFFIRGAPPGDVGYFLDGVRVPYLFHVGAGPSVIHPGLVDRVDLYPGGYPARFGRFSGGIVSGETTTPSPDLHGEYNVRIFDAGALMESPFADGRGTALVGGRYSYTAALFSLLNTNATLDYWDYQARVTYDVTPDDRVSAFAFGASDYLGQKTPTGDNVTIFGAEFYRLDLRYDHRLDKDGTMRTAVMAGLDRTRLDNGRFLRDELLGVRNEISYRLAPKALLRVGNDVQIDSYDIELSQADQNAATARIIGAFPSRKDIVFGTRGDVVLNAGGRLEVTPGVRLDFFGSEGATAFAVDPRISARTRVSDRLRLLSAFGIAHQAPSFVIPVPGFQPGGLHGGLQSAVQESVGFELDLGQSTTATATVFKNGFYNLSDALSVQQPQISGCAPGTFPGDTLAGDPGTQPSSGGNRTCGTPRFPPGTVGPDRSGGGGQAAQSNGDTRAANAFETRARGTAYGLELFLKRKLTSRIGGFVSYTLSRSTRTANGQDFIASFDRTHVFNAAVAYDLGRNWRAGTRITFYTGLPKAHDPTDPSSTRLSPFFRVDLRLEKRWPLQGRRWISFVAEWMNATLSKESIGTSCTLSGCQENKIGPVTIPSLGVEGGF